MSNEIKYVNEAGVRRIVTDTRARLTDLTTDVDSAFGFSLDLSDIDTTLSTTAKTISFSLPKDFSTDEYDIFAKVYAKLTRQSTNTSIPKTVAHGEALVPLTNDTTSKQRAELKCLPVNIFSRTVETIPGQTTSYVCHNKSIYYQNSTKIISKLTSSVEGVYSLDILCSLSYSALITHIYGFVRDNSSYSMSSPTVEYSNYITTSELGISYTAEIEAIEILLRKKLEATTE